MNYYQQGFALGLRWQEDYIPGGPWGCSCPKCRVENRLIFILRMYGPIIGLYYK